MKFFKCIKQYELYLNTGDGDFRHIIFIGQLFQVPDWTYLPDMWRYDVEKYWQEYYQEVEL